MATLAVARTTSGRRRSARPWPRSFYHRPAAAVARDLLGSILVSRLGGAVTAGRIVETEAYLGPEDAASHAAFRPSSRPLLYGPGGIAYVYRAYGIHLCLNAVAGAPGTPGCVLIRALEPTRGAPTMARRRRASPSSASLTNGPAKLTRALGITLRENGRDLGQGPLIVRRGHAVADVAVGRRVGISRAVDLRLRFWIPRNPFVSRPLPV